MTAKELATKLLEHPDFEIKFCLFRYFGGQFNRDSWTNIEVVDVEHSDKVIVLGGENE